MFNQENQTDIIPHGDLRGLNGAHVNVFHTQEVTATRVSDRPLKKLLPLGGSDLILACDPQQQLDSALL